jgi:hypothetical protein
MSVMQHLAAEARRREDISVLFLTPCHATPFYSHMHVNIPMDFFDCSPPGGPPVLNQISSRFSVECLPLENNAVTCRFFCPCLAESESIEACLGQARELEWVLA